MADKDVIKEHLKETRKDARDKRGAAERAMDAVMRAFEEDVRRTWERTQASLAEERGASCASILCEIGNLKTRLDEASRAIVEATSAAEAACRFRQTVEFDSATEAKKTPEDRMREHVEKAIAEQCMKHPDAPFKVVQNEKTGNWNVAGSDGTLMLVPAGELGIREEAEEVAKNMTIGYLRVTK